MSVFRVGSNKSSVNNFPSVRPTLDLDFANSKTLDPRITFTRASGGSYVGADGLIKLAGVNEARFDHDPVTGESLGLLVEEARTNLLTPSIPDNVSVFNATVVTNSIISPSGELNASLLREDTSNGEHYKDYGPTLTSGITYTYSVFYKAGSGNRNFSMRVAGINVAAQIVNVTTNTITSGTIVNYGNNWYRAYYSFTASATGATTVRFQLHNQYTYTGDGSSGIYVWGAQLEEGAFPTSYIPTVASTRTHAADNASMTGKNFSEWYRQDEGTFFVKSPNASGLVLWSTQRVLDVYGPRFQLGTAGDFAMVNDAAAVAFQMGSSPSYPKRIASAYKLGDYAQSNEGRLVSSTSNTICTGQAVLQIGELVNMYLNGTISRLTYYPKRLPNAQLQALTK